uniref:Peptidase_M13 domain-containing protein n=1 Tax=Strongyloides venezuelensis TaxID=75913 RepID=A0A0K0FQE0_STRVS
MTFSIKSDDVGINYNDTIENIVNAIKHQKSITRSDSKMWSCREKFSNLLKESVCLHSLMVVWPFIGVARRPATYTLAEPLFSKKFPSALNYGYLGFTIAQTILDAYDTKTINHNYNNFDSEERDKLVVSEESMDHMVTISKCFTQQRYKESKTIIHRDIDNILSTDKKITDNAKLKIAYRAYTNFVSNFSEEYIVVPGFEQYIEDQLFFIGFGRHFFEYTSEDSNVPYDAKPGNLYQKRVLIQS